MKKLTTIVLLAALAGEGTAAATAEAGKNCHDVIYGAPGTDYAQMIRTHPEEWSFRFRPYGQSSEWLWSDSNVKRVVDGEADADQKITALRVSCTDDGFDVLVYCSEPGLRDYLEKDGAVPRARIEYFIAPDDADTRAVQRHYMGVYGERKNRFYANQVHDRTYRDAVPDVTETTLEAAIVVKFHYDWRLFWDLLPTFPEKADNFWRLSIIRWAGGGMTWGGTVHQNSRAGYIRWPAFTPAQRTAILRRTLEKGYEEFRDLATSDDRLAVAPRTKIPDWKFRAELEAKRPQSYVSVNMDPGFRAELERMVAERKALAAGIARLGEMDAEEQERFYRDAADKLFNFRLDVQTRYARHLAGKL